MAYELSLRFMRDSFVPSGSPEKTLGAQEYWGPNT